MAVPKGAPKGGLGPKRRSRLYLILYYISMAAPKGGLGWRWAVDVARPANLAALLAAGPLIRAMARDASFVGLIPHGLIEGGLEEATHVVTAAFCEGLHEKSGPGQRDSSSGPSTPQDNNGRPSRRDTVGSPQLHQTWTHPTTRATSSRSPPRLTRTVTHPKARVLPRCVSKGPVRSGRLCPLAPAGAHPGAAGPMEPVSPAA